MNRLVPCAVVVDSRNMRGQSGKVFGWPRHVSVSGVKDALRLYGLDPVEIYVGVATRSADSHPSDNLTKSLTTNRNYRDQLVNDGATVLEGYLVERRRSGVTEEKQVDVLCAVQVCHLADKIAMGLSGAKCIVVLSEDMDLMPAYDFARERKVPAYAAAFDTVHRREDQREWLLLSEAALQLLVTPLGRHVGSSLRTRLATIATSTEARSLRWSVHAPTGKEGQFLMSGNLGAPGLWTPGRRVRVGEKADLFAVGLRIHPEDGGRFPHLVLAEDAPSGPMPDIERAEVLYWQSPTSVKVAVRDSTASLRATPGTLLPGQQVAVLRRTTGPDKATYLVGALSDPPKVDGWTSSTQLATVTVTGSAVGAWLPGVTVESQDPVRVHAAHLDHVSPGTRLTGFLSGHIARYAQPTMMPMTCCLPRE